MNKMIATAITGMAVIVVTLIVLASSYISAYNEGNRLERQLVSLMDNNRNMLAQYGQRLQEAAQVPALLASDLTELFSSANESRYGADGSQAAFQWIQEQNPNLDPAVYLQVQRIIEAGRLDFERAQTRLIDVRRVYETQLGSFWRGTWLRIAGYPKIDLSTIRIVSTDRANQAFETGVESDFIQLR